jgi:hypothetical protein
VTRSGLLFATRDLGFSPLPSKPESLAGDSGEDGWLLSIIRFAESLKINGKIQEKMVPSQAVFCMLFVQPLEGDERILSAYFSGPHGRWPKACSLWPCWFIMIHDRTDHLTIHAPIH